MQGATQYCLSVLGKRKLLQTEKEYLCNLNLYPLHLQAHSCATGRQEQGKQEQFFTLLKYCWQFLSLHIVQTARSVTEEEGQEKAARACVHRGHPCWHESAKYIEVGLLGSSDAAEYLHVHPRRAEPTSLHLEVSRRTTIDSDWPKFYSGGKTEILHKRSSVLFSVIPVSVTITIIVNYCTMEVKGIFEEDESVFPWNKNVFPNISDWMTTIQKSISAWCCFFPLLHHTPAYLPKYCRGQTQP